MSETWHTRGVVLPEGDGAEDWWIGGGVLHDQPLDGAEELPGRFVICGLVDSHVHLSMFPADGRPDGAAIVDANLDRHRNAGVLAVRDVGAVPGVSYDAGVRAGQGAQPLVLGGSRFLAPPGGYFPPLYEPTDPADLVKAAVAEVEAGADWVKVISDSPMTETAFFDAPANWSQEVLTDVVEAVHVAGGRVAAHVSGRGAADAVLAGVDSVEHGNSLDADLVHRMSEQGTAWTPTLGTVAAGSRAVMSESDHPMAEFARSQLELLSELVPLAARLGVPILAGTDMLGHGNLASEVAILTEFGLSPTQALAAASTTARELFGLPGLVPGAPADVVTYDADPRNDPEVLRSPAALLSAGIRVA